MSVIHRPIHRLICQLYKFLRFFIHHLTFDVFLSYNNNVCRLRHTGIIFNYFRRNIMKKIIAASAAAIILTSAASCGEAPAISQFNANDPAPVSEQSDSSSNVYIVQLSSSDTDFSSLINSFNATNDDFEVVLNDYSDNSDKYSDKAYEKLISDIDSHSAPDIVIAPPDKMKELMDKGLLTDLAPVLSEGNGIKKDDLLSNVIDSVTVNGSIYALYNSFIIETAAVKSSRYDESFTNWNPQQAVDAYSMIPDGTEFLYMQWTTGEIYSYFTKLFAYECVDTVNRTCDFSPLRELFTFLKSKPGITDRSKAMAGMEPDEASQFLSQMQNKLINDQALVNRITINGINQWYPVDRSHFGGADITFTGFPNISGNGVYTNVEMMFGILESSSVKPSAWEFLSSLFDEDKQVQTGLSGSGIPVLKSAVDKLAYHTDSETTGSVLVPCIRPDTGEQYVITGPEVDQLVNYISTAVLRPWHDEGINRIIEEECQALANSEISPEECLSHLNNRVNKYYENHTDQ